ncbi:hypothetical protein I5I61_18690 [Pseudomonas nitroreducens]|uniref:Uncharacterized protein n=1 Tax=Pseudomonas nitroreducens TaxID=46680 RepID=A0ABS0KPJ2_PSENT|nr:MULTISPECIES: hypothetical protein [Pseudomonas]MBG6289486.1 hypothetical protein [Pseudomonas nitroreducens]
MNEQLTLDGQPVVQKLRVFCVDESDYYAASTYEEAIAKHAEMLGCDPDDIDNCQEVTGPLLDEQWVDEDKAPLGTLREWLAEAKGVEWLTGTE